MPDSHSNTLGDDAPETGGIVPEAEDDPPETGGIPEADIVNLKSPTPSVDSAAAAAEAASPTQRAVAEIDLADSAARIIRLIEAGSEAKEAEAAAAEAEARAEADSDDGEAEEGGLAGFQRWLTRTRQLGRRATELLRAVRSLNGPPEQREHLEDLVRLSLLLECNSAIGFNADGTLRNAEEAARVETAAEAKEALRVDALLAEQMKDDDGRQHSGNTDDEFEPLRQDAEVLADKEELIGHRSGRSLFTFACAVLALTQVFRIRNAQRIWAVDWLLLVACTTVVLMIGITIFVSAGRRRRPVEAYREMGKELQNNRILLSTIRDNGY